MTDKTTPAGPVFDDEPRMRIYTEAESQRAWARIPDHLRPLLEKAKANRLKVLAARDAKRQP